MKIFKRKKNVYKCEGMIVVVVVIIIIVVDVVVDPGILDRACPFLFLFLFFYFTLRVFIGFRIGRKNLMPDFECLFYSLCLVIYVV